MALMAASGRSYSSWHSNLQHNKVLPFHGEMAERSKALESGLSNLVRKGVGSNPTFVSAFGLRVDIFYHLQYKEHGVRSTPRKLLAFAMLGRR